MVVTGSASFHLAARTRESLAGRATRHQVWPLSLEEVAPAGLAPAARAHHAPQALDRLLVFGGYPGAWTDPDPAPILLEVKAQRRGRPRTTRALRSFVEAYRPALVIVVHRGESYEDRLGDTPIVGVPAEGLSALMDEVI